MYQRRVGIPLFAVYLSMTVRTNEYFAVLTISVLNRLGKRHRLLIRSPSCVMYHVRLLVEFTWATRSILKFVFPRFTQTQALYLVHIAIAAAGAILRHAICTQ